MEISNVPSFVLAIVILATIMIALVFLPRLPKTFSSLRRVAAIDAVAEAVRVCAERGRPICNSPGAIGVGDARGSTWTLSSLAYSRFLAEEAGPLRVRILTTCSDAAFTMLVTDAVREGYATSGHPESFSSSDIYYMPSQPGLGYGTASLCLRERVGAFVGIGGHWWGSALPIYEVCANLGALTIAGEVWPEEAAMSALSVDYLVLPEEAVAGGAYLSKDLVQWNSIIGIDWIKLALVALMMLLVTGLVKIPEG